MTLTGRTLGDRYQLGEELDAGPTGRTYLARRLGLDLPVLVKVLDGERAASREAADLFRGEALLLGRLKHPNVVTVLDLGAAEDGLLYMVFEHVPGRTLSALLRDEGPQPTVVGLSLARQLVAGLAALHAAGVAHGDVTADHIMVHRTRDGAVRLKLIGFESARPIVEEGGPDAANDLEAAAHLVRALVGRSSPPRATVEDAAGRFASGTPTTEFERTATEPDEPGARLREGIGRALRLGDVDHTVELYLALGDLLFVGGEPESALEELAEAVNIVTLGGGAEGSEGPLELWRLLIVVAEIHARSGNPRAARVSAAHAHRHASRVGSMRGVSNAQRLLGSLEP